MAEYLKPKSPSSVNTYLACGHRFELKYIHGIKIGSGPAAQFGSAVHLVNEKFWGNYKLQPDSLIAMQDTIDAHWDKTITDEYEVAAHTCIDNFLAIVNETPTYTPTYTEFKAVDKVRNTTATIDVVYPEKIVDYKTSKLYSVKPKQDNIIQAVMCSDNLLHCTGMEVRNVQFQYLRMKKYQYVDVTPKLIDEVDNIIETMGDNIRDDVFPKNEKSCFFCDYKMVCRAEKKARDKNKNGGTQTHF